LGGSILQFSYRVGSLDITPMVFWSFSYISNVSNEGPHKAEFGRWYRIGSWKWLVLCCRY